MRVLRLIPFFLFFAEAGVAAAGSPLPGEGFNLDFGVPGTHPEESYGAAGTAGFWNADWHLDDPHTGDLLRPRDLKGEGAEWLSDVVITFSENLFPVEPSSQPFSTEDAMLLGDYLVTGSSQFALTVYGLPEGTYTFYFYAVGRQDFPTETTITPVNPNGNPVKIEGIWSDIFREGESYARFTLSTDGHQEFTFCVEGGDAFLNGMQVVAGEIGSSETIGEALETPQLNWSSEGDVSWTVQSIDGARNGTAAVAGDTAEGASTLTLNLDSPGRLFFSWLCEQFLDERAQVAVNGRLLAELDDRHRWERASLAVPPEGATVSFTLSESDYRNPGDLPAVFAIDDVKFESEAENHAPRIELALDEHYNAGEQITSGIERLSDLDGDLVSVEAGTLPLGFALDRPYSEFAQFEGFTLNRNRGLNTVSLNAWDGAAETNIEVDFMITSSFPEGIIQTESELIVSTQSRSEAFSVTDLVMDREGNLWIGAPITGHVSVMTQKSGDWMPADSIQGVYSSSFGTNLASVSGSVAVSAHAERVGSSWFSGAVYLYTPNGLGGFSERRLARAPLSYRRYGERIASWGSTLAVGYSENDQGESPSVLVDLYDVGLNGEVDGPLTVTGIPNDDVEIGPSTGIAICEEWLAVNTRTNVGGLREVGAVYLFHLSRSEGVVVSAEQVARLTPPVPSSYLGFGSSLAVVGGFLYVGASNEGLVYRYHLSPTGKVVFLGELRAPDSESTFAFGHTLEANSKYLAIGSRERSAGFSSPGIIYFYHHAESVESELDLISRYEVCRYESLSDFGFSIAMSDSELYTAATLQSTNEQEGTSYAWAILGYPLDSYARWLSSINVVPGATQGDRNANGRADLFEYWSGQEGHRPEIIFEGIDENLEAVISVDYDPSARGVISQLKVSDDLIHWDLYYPVLLDPGPPMVWSIPAGFEDQFFFKLDLEHSDSDSENN